MSDRSAAERPTATSWLNAETSINNLTFLIGVSAIVGAVVGGSCSTNARIGDLRMEIGNVRTEMRDLRTEMRTEARDLRTEMRTEMRDLRGQVERLEDSTAASFEAVRQQLVAVAVCTLELRNAVAAAGRSAQNGDRGAEFTACDSAQRAILTPSTPSSP